MKEKGKKKIKPFILIIILLVIACLMVAVIFTINSTQQASGSGDEISSDSSAESIEISTPVGTLTFPKEWSASVRIEDTSFNDQFSRTFYGKVGEKEALLFEISVGNDGEGYQLGNVPDDEGNPQFIWLNIREIKTDSSWSEEETSQLNMMQGCVNDLIEQFRNLDGFKEGN